VSRLFESCVSERTESEIEYCVFRFSSPLVTRSSGLGMDFRFDLQHDQHLLSGSCRCGTRQKPCSNQRWNRLENRGRFKKEMEGNEERATFFFFFFFFFF
jgi:hypothetical protein